METKFCWLSHPYTTLVTSWSEFEDYALCAVKAKTVCLHCHKVLYEATTATRAFRPLPHNVRQTVQDQVLKVAQEQADSFATKRIEEASALKKALREHMCK